MLSSLAGSGGSEVPGVPGFVLGSGVLLWVPGTREPGTLNREPAEPREPPGPPEPVIRFSPARAIPQRLLQRVPGERRALDARRKLADARRARRACPPPSRQPPDRSASSPCVNAIEQVERLATVWPLTASVISEADALEIAQPDPSNATPLDAIAVDLDVDASADRRRAGCGPCATRWRPSSAPEVPRPAIVVEDDFLVEVGEIRHCHGSQGHSGPWPEADLEHSQLQLRGLGHPVLVPRRLPDDLDPRVGDAGNRLDLVAHFAGESAAPTGTPDS